MPECWAPVGETVDPTCLFKYREVSLKHGRSSGDCMEGEDPRAVAAKKGAKWGSVGGLVLAQLYLSQNSPLGFYTGNLALVFLFCIGLGVAFGAALGWWGATID